MAFFDRPAMIEYVKDPAPEKLAILLIAYANFMAARGEFYVRGTKAPNGSFVLSVIENEEGTWLPVFTAEAECGPVGKNQVLGRMGARKALQNIVNSDKFCGMIINPITMGIMLEKEDVIFLEQNS